MVRLHPLEPYLANHALEEKRCRTGVRRQQLRQWRNGRRIGLKIRFLRVRLPPAVLYGA